MELIFPPENGVQYQSGQFIATSGRRWWKRVTKDGVVVWEELKPITEAERKALGRDGEVKIG